ncbi:HipA family kinase [Paraburkholderia sp. EG286B]|uniref:HipA family kinase n=1 Tax=Paraburkholderia sp. EG286B TaxID=3237011 RepID=UPI0034D31159
MPSLELPFDYGSLRYRPNTVVAQASNPVIYGRVQLLSVEQEMAFVKLLQQGAFTVESVCAWLARAVGLQAPRPLWVNVPRNRVPAGHWPFGDKEAQLCFATVELPNARPLHFDEASSDVVFNQARLDDVLMAKIATFDSLIGNDDRHGGNLLLAPPAGVFVIDHGRALGGVGTDSTSIWLPPGPNVLLRRIQAMPPHRRHALKQPLRQFCEDCVLAVDKLPLDKLVESESIREMIRRHLRAKAETLRVEMLDSIGIPELAGINRSGSRPTAP